MRKKTNGLKTVCTLALAGVLSLSLMACGSRGTSGKPGSSSKKLNIMIWGDTISDTTISNFEKETGIKVNVSYIDNTDSLLAKMVNSSEHYDVVSIESAYLKTFTDAGLLQKLDKSKLTNMQDMEPTYNKGFTGDEDETYTIPVSGPIFTTIMYNKKTCPVEIKSFQDLADPKLKGQIAMVNSTISFFGAALESLGYSADTTNEDEIKKATDLLMKIKENVKDFSGTSAASLIENGDVSVSFGWDYPLVCGESKDNWDTYAQAELDSPYEMSVGYAGIPKTAQNYEGALAFINTIIDPKEQARGVKEFGGVPVTSQSATESYLPDGYYDNPAVKSNLAYASDPSKNWAISINDDQISLLDTYYNKLMAD